MKKILHFLTILSISVMSLASCTDLDRDGLSLPQSSVTQTDGKYHIKFFLPQHWVMGNSSTNITLQFYPLDGRAEPYVYMAQLHNDGIHHISFAINPENDEDLPSGKYLLRGVDPDGSKYIPRIVVTVEERLVKFLEVAPQMIGFAQGKGTADEPYEILSKTDFSSLLTMLHNDPTYCRDVHFIQKNNITLDGSEGLVDENGWFSEPFAGNYNGGGYTINGVYYQGSGSKVGLFREFYGGAKISNLTVSISSIHSSGNEIGGLAGCAYGSVSIDSCTIMGHMEGHDYVGGLIGHVKPGASVKIDNVELAVTIANSHDRTGGLIGSSDVDSHISISNITTNSAAFEISGNDYVGGLIGHSYHTTLTINNATLSHTVFEATDVVTIGGNSCVGGLVGLLEDEGGSSGYRPGEMPETWYRNIKIENASVSCPIRAKGNSVGGIIGRAYGRTGYEEAHFSNITSSSPIEGADYVGGFTGSIDNIKCHFNNCSVKASGFNLISIKGNNYIGGFLGIENSTNYFSTIGISTNVTGSGECVGGFAGQSRNEISLGNFKFEPTMKVTGNKYVGGVSGKHIGNIHGNYNNSFSYGQASIPKVPDKADFSVKVYGYENVGGVVGQIINSGSKTAIMNLHARCEVSGNSCVGGIAGIADYGTAIRNCASDATVNATDAYCGGIAGKVMNSAAIEQCINYATITGKLDTGGIVGAAAKDGNSSSFPLVNYCVNVGNTTGEGRAGGVVGIISVQDDNLHDIITNCANYGKVTCNDFSSNTISTSSLKAFGGIVGASDEAGARVVGCANHGEVIGNLEAHGGGGIAGSMGNDPGFADSKDAYNFVIHSCINTANISNDNSNCHLGGILGYAEEGDDNYRPDAAVLGCLNKGDITSLQESSTGGIVGELDWYGQIEFCCCIPDLSHEYNLWEGGVKYDALLYESYRVQNNATYESAEPGHYSQIGTVYWEIPSSVGYPILKNCPFQATLY